MVEHGAVHSHCYVFLLKTASRLLRTGEARARVARATAAETAALR